MDEIEQRLRQLVIDTCRHKSGSVERQQGLTQIVRSIVTSGKLWRQQVPYYEDALQQTWLYFCRNLCEATTSDKSYDPHQGSITTWLNAYLKRRLQDGQIQNRVALAQTVAVVDDLINTVETLEAPPDVPPILETTKNWIENDPEGDLSRLHIQGHPQVTCQVLLLQRLPPEQSWEALAAQFGISVSTLRSFYRRQCLPRLRKFGESQGYIEDTYHDLQLQRNRRFLTTADRRRST